MCPAGKPQPNEQIEIWVAGSLRMRSIRLKSFWFFLPEGFLALTRHSPQAVSAQVTPLGSSEKEQYPPDKVQEGRMVL